MSLDKALDLMTNVLDGHEPPPPTVEEVPMVVDGLIRLCSLLLTDLPDPMATMAEIRRSAMMSAMSQQRDEQGKFSTTDGLRDDAGQVVWDEPLDAEDLPEDPEFPSRPEDFDEYGERDYYDDPEPEEHEVDPRYDSDWVRRINAERYRQDQW